MKSFKTTRLASQAFNCNFDEKIYFERTKRNHYWLGGLAGQQKLYDLKLGVAGLGGMGSNLAEIFVRLGVGHLKIADGDIIQLSNLNRQVIANRHTVGMKKAVASSTELRNIAEDFELVVYDDGITEKNVEEFVSDLDVIIDEIDVFPFRAHVWLHAAAQKRNLPLYSGFIIGLGTHIFKFQGTDFTFEDFMLRDQKQIDSPSPDFIMNRLATPAPSYLRKAKNQKKFKETILNKTVPIFGASTFLSHSFVAIRVLTDYLGLNDQIGGVKTPVMPQFLKVDPLDLKIEVCDIRKQS